MDNYILLLHESPSFGKNLSPDQIQAILTRYKAWMKKTADAGRLAGGQKLEDGTARIMTGEGPALRVTDGPYAETKDVIGGFFMIQASSYEDAVEWCKDCPHLSYGRIELRKVEVVPG
jgi:hypothetical protein